MQKIVVATDLSKAAMNAAVYAANLAKVLELPLELYNAFAIPFSYSQSPLPMDSINDIEQIAVEELKKEKAFLEEKVPGVQITYKATPGDIIENLNEDYNTDGPTFLVLGTSGKGDTLLWGSVAIRALRSFPFPVLAIPKSVRWHGVSHISLAVDYKNIPTDAPILMVKAVLKLLSAHLSILNVYHTGEATPVPYMFEQAVKDLGPEFHSYSADTVDEGVQRFVDEHHPDWLAVLPQKYGFFEGLFHSSQTKQIAKTTEIPVLALGTQA